LPANRESDRRADKQTNKRLSSVNTTEGAEGKGKKENKININIGCKVASSRNRYCNDGRYGFISRLNMGIPYEMKWLNWQVHKNIYKFSSGLSQKIKSIS